MGYRIKIDAQIMVECDTPDEVRNLVAVIQMPYVLQKKERYISSIPVNDQIVIPEGERIPLILPTLPRKRRRKIKKEPKISEREQIAISRRSKIVEYIKMQAKPIHRQELLQTFRTNENEDNRSWLDNALQKLVHQGFLQRTKPYGFYIYANGHSVVG